MGAITVKPYNWCVFHEESMAAMFTPTGGRVGGMVRTEALSDVGELEASMLAALSIERDALQVQRGGER